MVLLRQRGDTEEVEALLVLRKSRREEVLEVPKGHMEHGENSVEAAVRECRQETGLSSQVRMLKKLTPTSYLLRDSSQSTQVPFPFPSVVQIRFGEPSESWC